ncbi:MAG: asparagine synthase (glutamine-hydrolyzing) [Bacteroidota bacterium]|nr:asparagine synthase (glutamine-hydrolyzing) [Bacteroidota bacterium]
MCGITGIIKLNNIDLDLAFTVKKMTDCIKHRGPDDEGFVFPDNNPAIVAFGKDTIAEARNREFKYSPDKNIDEINPDSRVALGHRRLSIIDLSPIAHLPMCCNDENIWITYNGEIYNYIELRNELSALGYRFKTSGDTEVLINAYKEWGKDCLNKLNGMWAFVIYDKQKNLIFGSRDRFGVKPFYYYKDDKILAFASEHKALLKIACLNTGVNQKAVFKHLFMSQVEQFDQGFFENIYELQPSHFFTLDLNSNNFEVKRYYTLKVNYSDIFDESKTKDYVSNIQNLILNSISLRLRSDVPVGFCLSGGLDSSTIVSAAYNINKEKALPKFSSGLNVFTAINESHEFDEREWAEKVVNDFSLIWHKVQCSHCDLLDLLPSIIYHQDIPLLGTSTFAQNKVMKFASETGIKILLDGQGGDELFCGYVPFYISQYFDLIRKLKFGLLSSEMKNIGNSPTNFNLIIKGFIKSAVDIFIPNAIYHSLIRNTKNYLQYSNPDFWVTNSEDANFSGDYKLQGLNESLNHYFTGNYLKNLLRWEDRCSMQYSIESRTPFADDINLIEYVFNIPGTYKIQKGWSKYLLRESMSKYLPSTITYRKDKLGFSTPQQRWLQEINQSMKLIICETEDKDHFINKHKVLKEWDNVFSNNKLSKTQDFFWRYMNYLIWRKIFF